MKLLYKLCILALLPVLTFANNGKFKGKYTKEKKVEREFTVNSDAGLEVQNKYGNVDITTWNENKTVIEIMIKANGNNESRVQERLDDVNIDLSGNATRVTAITNLGSTNSNWGKNENVLLEISYTIKMPKTNTVDISNKYGAVTLGDLKGNARISNKYGQLSLGELQAEENSITIKYVKTASIKYMKSGKINAGYSNFTLDRAEDLNLEAGYTTSKLGTIGDLNYNNKYGKLFVTNVKNVIGNAGYNNGTFDTVSGNANFNVKYSTISVDLFTETAKDITFNGKYSKFNLGIHKDYAFQFDMKLKYGNLKGKNLLTLTSQESKSQNKQYSGYHGSKGADNKININSTYGNISIK